ncbi:MAG: hypothetical protein COA57_06605 [Flavobacteriales bacterium]|nr:MAG: hypothetical protein COA57_06605 [Flavobacteriales bacterium]
MLVDDNEIDNFINQKMLEGTGFAEKVFTYTSGISALEFLKNLERKTNAMQDFVPDYIFLDINMPMMDGFQFLQEFEKLSSVITEKSKIAILTTSINPVDQKNSEKNAWVSIFVNKPLTEKILEDL